MRFVRRERETKRIETFARSCWRERDGNTPHEETQNESVPVRSYFDNKSRILSSSASLSLSLDFIDAVLEDVILFYRSE